VRALVRPSGWVAVKDWEPSATPIHAACYLLDRYVTGDRVHYLTAGALRAELEGAFGPDSLLDETRVRPWRNNVGFLVRRG
jgi:hypothetical protein